MSHPICVSPNLCLTLVSTKISTPVQLRGRIVPRAEPRGAILRLRSGHQDDSMASRGPSQQPKCDLGRAETRHHRPTIFVLSLTAKVSLALNCICLHMFTWFQGAPTNQHVHCSFMDAHPQTSSYSLESLPHYRHHSALHPRRCWTNSSSCKWGQATSKQVLLRSLKPPWKLLGAWLNQPEPDSVPTAAVANQLSWKGQ